MDLGAEELAKQAAGSGAQDHAVSIGSGGAGTIQLTIITPAFRGAKFLPACIQNVAEQWQAGIEHIILDGGSDDGTVEILQAAGETHAHLRWVSERDRGQSDAMNRGIQMARGQWISFLNADDEYMPGTLARVLGLIPGMPPLGFLVGDCAQVDAEGKSIRTMRVTSMKPWDLINYPHKHFFPANPASYFYDKALHDLVGLYPVEDHQTMDVEFLLSIVPVAKVRHYPEVWGQMLVAPGGKTHDAIAAGWLAQHTAKVFDRHRQKLPWRHRVWHRLVLSRQARYARARAMHYVTHPWEAPLFLVKGVRKILGKLLRR